MIEQVKPIAFYLPQYHCIKENDEWWGMGFTDWVNVKAAQPLFSGHQQPKQPLNDNYYNLLDDKVRLWQCELAKKYGIYGFCYYHYWFHGKLLLEKPLEATLNNHKIDLPFCICWANELWSRTWEGKSRDVLIDQNYGDESEWKRHFEYLVPFFKDDRYIKIDNKPVLVIYRSSNIERYEEMVRFWRVECSRIGLSGLYIVEENNSFQNRVDNQVMNAILDFEPMYTIQHGRTFIEKVYQRMLSSVNSLKHRNSIHSYNYDTIWKAILRRNQGTEEVKRFLGAFVAWDNTARKGKKGVVINGASPEKFKYYLSKQIEYAKKTDSEFIFINAWNEWAEGTYLEPDKKNGFGYLEKVKECI